MKSPAIIATVVIGLLAVVVTFLFMKKKGQPPPATKQIAHYVVVKAAIPPRTPITEAMIEETTESGVQDGSCYSSKGEVLGKTANRPIAKGERIKKEVLAASASSFQIPPQRRGIALFLDQNLTVAGLVNVGDHVDVLVVYNETADAVARTVAQDCLVVSVDHPGQSSSASAQGKAGGKAEAKAESKPGAPPAAPAASADMLRVVVAAAPDEVVKITAASQKGDIRLALRNPDNPFIADVEEEWEHPHKIHKHYPFPAPASPENVPTRSTGPRVSSSDQTPSVSPRLPVAPFFKGGIPGPPTGAPKPREKSVDVVRGTTKETVSVSE